MEGSNVNALRHLYLRAGFGISAETFEKQKSKSFSQSVDQLFDSAASFVALKINKDLHPPKYYAKDLMVVMSKEERKKVRKESIMDELAMNVLWIDKMTQFNGQLREKMTLFWHGHFACRDQVALYAENLNNTLRQNALGNFGDLLLAVSKDPAMLRYLNNQQNKKQSPNENFAREVMELFTIGRGNYTEDDIKNGARAFTGWTADGDGNFVFRKNQHDDGIKTFMGHSGNFDGEDILKIILSRKETAHFIAAKAYKYFVNQENPDPAVIDDLGKSFYESDYNISTLMRNIFTSDWFYDPKNMGNRIKSPVELIVGMKRDFKVVFEKPEAVAGLQKLLGQVLFNPPNVSGWAGGRNWIDSSSLLYRMKLPEAILMGSGMDATIQGDLMESKKMAAINQRILKNMKCTVDIGYYSDTYKTSTPEQLVDSLSISLLAPGIQNIDKKLVLDFVKNTGDNPVKAAIMRIASLPEYQLC
jgi:uncharacterized protein (DUF1800 family)